MKLLIILAGISLYTASAMGAPTDKELCIQTLNESYEEFNQYANRWLLRNPGHQLALQPPNGEEIPRDLDYSMAANLKILFDRHKSFYIGLRRVSHLAQSAATTESQYVAAMMQLRQEKAYQLEQSAQLAIADQVFLDVVESAHRMGINAIATLKSKSDYFEKTACATHLNEASFTSIAKIVTLLEDEVKGMAFSRTFVILAVKKRQVIIDLLSSAIERLLGHKAQEHNIRDLQNIQTNIDRIYRQEELLHEIALLRESALHGAQLRTDIRTDFQYHRPRQVLASFRQQGINLRAQLQALNADQGAALTSYVNETVVAIERRLKLHQDLGWRAFDAKQKQYVSQQRHAPTAACSALIRAFDSIEDREGEYAAFTAREPIFAQLRPVCEEGRP
jgi:hypothetical protein